MTSSIEVGSERRSHTKFGDDVTNIQVVTQHANQAITQQT